MKVYADSNEFIFIDGKNYASVISSNRLLHYKNSKPFIKVNDKKKL